MRAKLTFILDSNIYNVCAYMMHFHTSVIYKYYVSWEFDDFYLIKIHIF